SDPVLSCPGIEVALPRDCRGTAAALLDALQRSHLAFALADCFELNPSATERSSSRRLFRRRPASSSKHGLTCFQAASQFWHLCPCRLRQNSSSAAMLPCSHSRESIIRYRPTASKLIRATASAPQKS